MTQLSEIPSENRPEIASKPPVSSPIQRLAGPLFRRYIAFVARYPGLLLLGFLAITGLTLIPISQLELHTDLAELLPDDHPAVQALRRVGPRQISSTNLVVILESPDAAANRRLAEALRPDLTKLIGSVFSEIQWRPDTEVPDYAAKWQWLYASLTDLGSAETLLDRLIARRTSPLVVDLEGDPEAELKALRTKLNQALPPRNDSTYFEFQPPNDPAYKHYPDKNLHYLGIMLWRRGDGLATTGDQQTISLVEKLIASKNPQQFHPQMSIEYSGGIAMAIDEHKAVQEDLTKATGVCVFLVLLAIYLYFRRVAVLAVVGAPAVLGVLLALAMSRYTIHYLNANTAFLISIILGNGINSPIILLARYGEERRRGQAVPQALLTAMTETLVATATATAAASISYACLLATSLRGFNQFGLVGGTGMLLAWSLSFLLVPPLVVFGERLRPGILTPKPALWRGPFALLGRLTQRHPVALIGISLALVAVATVPALRYSRDPIEYNFDNLRTDNPATATAGASCMTSASVIWAPGTSRAMG